METLTVEFTQPIVLLDIEGTTTSISFVKDTLFPFARKNLKDYIERNWSKEELQDVVKLLKQQCEEDKSNELTGLIPITDGEGEIQSIVENVNWQMDNDRKTFALKKLQGFIWKDGYHSGQLKSHLYEDVVPALKSWQNKGRKLIIYSSGSVEAQKLLFGFSIFGNLLDLFSNYFDTNIGAKVNKESYLNIANELNCNCSDILFITDVVKEADAASEAGCNVIISERPGNAPLSPEDREKYKCVRSFSQVYPK